MTAVSFNGSEVVLRISAPRFSDFLLADSRFGRETDVGTLKVQRWTQAEIDAYLLDRKRWERYGSRLQDAVGVLFHRRVLGGLVGAGAKRLRVPLRAPCDRTRLVSGCLFDGDAA